MKILAFLLASCVSANAGSITISITTTTPQSGVNAGTVTRTETFTDAGLINSFGNWLLVNFPTCDGPPGPGGVPSKVACPMSGANLNASYQLWSAAFINATKAQVLRDAQNAAAKAAADGVPPIQ